MVALCGGQAVTATHLENHPTLGTTMSYTQLEDYAAVCTKASLAYILILGMLT